MGYKNKTQKKRACISIQSKAMKLFSTGCMTMADANAINKICNATIKRL